MGFQKIAKVSLVLVYLVIIAGAVVRMTGSGMGCPDWPKCFGYYFPPTEVSQLHWKPNHDYKKGQVIIVDESLKVANKDFKTASVFEKTNWETYTKHNYAVFNPSHTWVEFINRLFGALAGLATLILAIYSFKYRKKKKIVTILAWTVVFGMVFQAWLGATVVYSVLEPVKITIHMLMALIIVALLFYLVHITGNTVNQHKRDKVLLNLFILALTLTIIQVVLGTQVRQYIDNQIDILGEGSNELWLQDPTLQFYIHRSFSILITLLNFYLGYRVYKLKLGYSKIAWVIGLILAEIITGLAMYHLDFPFASQPMHLLLASLLFGVQFYLILEVLKADRSLKSL